MMRHVQPNVIILPIILTQDETTQDGSNRRTLKPMYAQFGNVRVRERNQTWARVCVGYIPTPNKNEKPRGMKKAEYQRAKRALFHAAMDVLLAPLRVYQRTGVLMQLPGRDGRLYTCKLTCCEVLTSREVPKPSWRWMPSIASIPNLLHIVG